MSLFRNPFLCFFPPNCFLFRFNPTCHTPSSRLVNYLYFPARPATFVCISFALLKFVLFAFSSLVPIFSCLLKFYRDIPLGHSFFSSHLDEFPEKPGFPHQARPSSYRLSSCNIFAPIFVVSLLFSITSGGHDGRPTSSSGSHHQHFFSPALHFFRKSPDQMLLFLLNI